MGAGVSGCRIGRAEGSFQLHVHVDVVTLASALGFVPSRGRGRVARRDADIRCSRRRQAPKAVRRWGRFSALELIWSWLAVGDSPAIKRFSESRHLDSCDAFGSEAATAGSAANRAYSASTKRRLNGMQAGIVAKRRKSRHVQ